MTLLLTIKQAAQELQMSEGWVKAQIRAGELRSGKFGRSRRILMDDLKEFALRKIEVSAWVEGGVLTEGMPFTPTDKPVSYRR